MGSAVGGLIAPGVGSVAGGILGQGAGAIIDHITGQGDYTVHRNTLIKASPVPTFGKACIRVEHREMIRNVLSSTDFTLFALNINPGLQETFPWLSRIAQNFEMYRMNGCIFEWVTNSGDALTATNTALGKVIMATDYNVLDSNFTSDQQMYATEFSNSGKPSMNLIHAVECAPAENPLKLNYIRSGTVEPGADPRLYDLGKFQLAVSGCQSAGNQLGELWVSYDVSLCKPSLQAVDAGDGLLSYHGRMDNYSAIGTLPFLIPSNLQPFNGCTMILDNTDFDSLEFPEQVEEGRFVVILAMTGNSTAITQPPTASVSNGSFVPNWWSNNAFTTTFAPQTGATSTRMIYIACVDVNAPGQQRCVVNFVGGTWPSVPTALDVLVLQMPSTQA